MSTEFRLAARNRGNSPVSSGWPGGTRLLCVENSWYCQVRMFRITLICTDFKIGVSFWLWQVTRTATMGQPDQRTRHQYPHHQHCTALRSPLISNRTLPISNTSCLWLLVLVFVICSGTLLSVAEGKTLTDVTSSVEHHQVIKRSATDGSLPAPDYGEYQPGVRYDEYPVSTSAWLICVPITRIALL